jgi:hypothetical protein
LFNTKKLSVRVVAVAEALQKYHMVVLPKTTGLAPVVFGFQ